MIRTFLAAVAVAVAALGAVSKAEACDACAQFIARQNQKHEGKLVKYVEEIHQLEQSTIYPRRPSYHVVWVLKTADKKYELNLGSRTLVREASALEGRKVTVTGPLEGGTINVRALEAKPTEFTGILRAWEKKDLPVSYKLKTADGEDNLILNEEQLAQAKKLAGKRVVVKGKLTVSGVVVTSIEESPWRTICPGIGN